MSDNVGLFGIGIMRLYLQTGAGISCSDPGAHERVIAFSGSVDTIFKAFSLACRLTNAQQCSKANFWSRKLWEFVRGLSEPNNPRPLALRLAVPAQQCGSIIGKQVMSGEIANQNNPISMSWFTSNIREPKSRRLGT